MPPNGFGPEALGLYTEHHGLIFLHEFAGWPASMCLLECFSGGIPLGWSNVTFCNISHRRRQLFLQEPAGSAEARWNTNINSKHHGQETSTYSGSPCRRRAWLRPLGIHYREASMPFCGRRRSILLRGNPSFID